MVVWLNQWVKECTSPLFTPPLDSPRRGVSGETRASEFPGDWRAVLLLHLGGGPAGEAPAQAVHGVLLRDGTGRTVPCHRGPEVPGERGRGFVCVCRPRTNLTSSTWYSLWKLLLTVSPVTSSGRGSHGSFSLPSSRASQLMKRHGEQGF